MNKKISTLPSADAIDGSELVPIVQSGTTKQTTISELRPYKVYTALLTQSGTDAPTAIVLENTIGEIVWSYNGVGDYFGTLVGAFTLNKTIGFIGSNGNFTQSYSCLVISNSTIDTINIQSFDIDSQNVNEILFQTYFELRVYN